MTLKIDYKDTITLYRISADEYGDDVLEDSAEVRGTFINGTGYGHVANQGQITTDARVYVDPEDSFVQANAYRMEEMLVLAPMFGVDSSRAWYKVVTATVARDHLLTNSIDNVRLGLKKTKEPVGVS